MRLKRWPSKPFRFKNSFLPCIWFRDKVHLGNVLMRRKRHQKNELWEHLLRRSLLCTKWLSAIHRSSHIETFYQVSAAKDNLLIGTYQY